MDTDLMLTEAYLGLGSNLGDRQQRICYAVECLQRLSTHTTVSSLYETTPQGYKDQPSFLNAACCIWTRLEPFELLERLQEIEVELGGRKRAFVNGPRWLDIDVLTYGRMVLSSPLLTIPHPRMAERLFVLAPLAEIAPTLRHPLLKQDVRALLDRLADSEPTSPARRELMTHWTLNSGGSRFGIVSSIG